MNIQDSCNGHNCNFFYNVKNRYLFSSDANFLVINFFNENSNFSFHLALLMCFGIYQKYFDFAADFFTMQPCCGMLGRHKIHAVTGV